MILLIIYAVFFIPSYLTCRYIEKREWFPFQISNWKHGLLFFLSVWAIAPIGLTYAFLKVYVWDKVFK